MTLHTLTKAIDRDLTEVEKSIWSEKTDDTFDLLAAISGARGAVTRLEGHLAGLGITKGLDDGVEAHAVIVLKSMFLERPDETTSAFKVARQAWAIWLLLVAHGQMVGQSGAAGEAMADCMTIVDYMITAIELEGDTDRGETAAAA